VVERDPSGRADLWRDGCVLARSCPCVLGDGVRVVVAAVVVQVVEVVVAQVVEVVEVLVVVVVAAGAFARPVSSQTSWGRTCRVLLAAEDR